MIMKLSNCQEAPATSRSHTLPPLIVLAAMWRFKPPSCLLAGLALLLSAASALGQGSFQNLDFESAHIPSGTQPLAELSFSAALPGWSGTYSNSGGTSPATSVVYDGMSLGGPMMAIIDTLNLGAKPLQGNYSPYLFGGVIPPAQPTTMTISQTGLVPLGTTAILMDVQAQNGFTASLGGQPVNMVPVGGGTSFTEYSGDISAFAGQTAQLSTTVPSSPIGDINPNGLLIDDIRFVIVPEPSICALSALGVLLLSRCIRGGQR